MLTVHSGQDSRNCDGLSRRDFIKVGAIGLGSLSLPGLLAARAKASPGFVRNKSVVMLFLSGGASHIETFNPNMNGPDPSRSVTGEVPTCLPGVSFGGTFPQLAKNADKMAVVRSFRHPIGGHVQAIIHLLTGGTDPTGQGNQGFSMGSLYTRLRGANHERTGMPTYALLTHPNEVDGQYRSERGRVQRGSRPLGLGPAYGPFEPNGNGPAVENMQLNVKISPDRLGDRRALLASLDRFNRQADTQGMMEGFDRFEQQAFDLITGDASRAFDLSQEDPRVVERYDTSRHMVGKKTFRPSALGKHMLIARRLCQAGCGYVTVHSAGWDMHADSNNPGIYNGMEMLGRPVDTAVSAFLEDLERLGMLDDVLLIITGDFGRTPRINGRGGRDHWANLCTLAFAGGGGLKMGQVIGRSARNNDVPDSDPISTPNLRATVMHAMFDIGALRLETGIPRDILNIVENDAPIAELF